MKDLFKNLLKFLFKDLEGSKIFPLIGQLSNEKTNENKVFQFKFEVFE